MTTDNRNSGGDSKGKQKKSISKLLLPYKPNKVGVEPRTAEFDAHSTLRTQSFRSTVLERPLSLEVCSVHPIRKVKKVNGHIRKSSSFSENDLYLKSPHSDYEDSNILEKSASHNNILRAESKRESKSKSSANNLARKALLAAHVLHLIPTATARQRNYLQGRIGAHSLLGIAELEKTLSTSHQVTVFVGTWNMNGQCPPRELNDFVLPTGLEHVPDILVFGTQETTTERFEWEVSLQETLGPSHVLYHSTSLGTIHLVIFLRRDLIWYCSLSDDSSLSVRPGTAFRTKGAVASAFILFGTSFLFVTAHLTAHQEKVKERVSDVKKIVHSLDLPRILPIKNKNKDVTQNFDYVFWFGDLNFRLASPRSKVLEWISSTSFPLPSHMPHGYMHHDQLCTVLADGAAFHGFNESNITFPPTYKYDPGTQNFDSSSKQRTPAYTDRILYKERFQKRVNSENDKTTTKVECLVYDSVSSITTSDHKPVWGVFRVKIRPGIDTIPLAAGLFNRDVYLEGIHRRATSGNDSKPGSAALECGFSVARGHFDEVQRLLRNCVEFKDLDYFRNYNFSTTPEFVTTTVRTDVIRNDSSSSLESQSDETDDANPQVNTARIAQIRFRNPTVSENGNQDSRTTYNTLSSDRNETFRAQTPILTVQPASSSGSVSTVPDYSSDHDDDQDQTSASDESEQSHETNTTDNHCIIRCLLEQMSVLNETGFPDRQKLSKELLKKVVGRDVEEFFQDSISNCYQQTDDKYLDSCEFSTELILCLVEKGKANCNDWPVGIFSYQP